ncbi:MAG: glycosyltransferase family 1 protein [Lachnospiraceae bacterium]|nr:glycosyltransferase family 1 protein [Lachnospiraceae bacterium]
MKKRLILTVGVLDTLDIFTYAMIPEFEKLGYELLIFDTRKMQESLGALAQFAARPVTAMLCFNNLGFNMELVPGKNIWEELSIPPINILMDHPYMHKKALDQAPKNAIVLVIDRNHMKYLNRFYPELSAVGFLPHGGSDEGITPPPMRGRTIPLLYAGGVSLPGRAAPLPDLSGYDFDAKTVSENALSLLIEEPHHTVEEALEKVLLDRGIRLTEDALCSVIADLHFIDGMAVSHFREKLIRTLSEAGLPIFLYGNNWQHLPWISSSPSLHFGGRVSSYKIVEMMRDTKIVLNTMTWFKDGTHDRIFNGMLGGAVAMSDSSLYMKESFEDGKELILFELEDIPTLPDKVRSLLSNEKQLEEIARTGYERAVSRESWQARARELDRDLISQLS